MARPNMIIAVACMALATGAFGRDLLKSDAKTPAPTPDYAPATTGTVNGVEGYLCPSPGSTGYKFQPAPCKFGAYAGEDVYCDESTEGEGIVGVRDEEGGECVNTDECDTGFFCNIHFNNGTCTAVANTLCFAGALAPTPAPAPAPLLSLY
jgi:hypothetical protein